MYAIDPSKIDASHIAELERECMDGDRLKVMPADFYRKFAQEELSLFCVQNGIYSLPTTELLDTLNELIMEVSPTRNAIEIGAGNGAIGRGLGIPATDSFLQDNGMMKAHYASLKQATVKYGSDVIKLDANAAVKKMRPEATLGAWVTHAYNPFDPQRGGNQFGIDEEAIIQSVKRYIIVGNNTVHSKKPIWDKMTRMIRADYIFSRSLAGVDQNAIYIWDRE
ncbi:hypothetical protein [Pseudomonas putida]|uniref:Uncharacterized protein n=1 Tax=Pseudomonas putida TaxID=303 RepID=A0A8I1JIQ4_PSEPU|nr:hypothetical protein [Pseudomonas putida]MBI6882789.1 hypothetical protein [Pseudomonas putida]